MQNNTEIMLEMLSRVCKSICVSTWLVLPLASNPPRASKLNLVIHGTELKVVLEEHQREAESQENITSTRSIPPTLPAALRG